jgi:hypothetical protein
MRKPPFATAVLVACLALAFVSPSAVAQISVGVQLEGVSIGINVPVYPQLVRVPGYPVYYDPRGDSNYFFYDGLYWVYRDDVWYESSWYNGPWRVRESAYVPDYVLRVPVRYYRRPPTYFRGWRADAAPRWDEHWGREWQQSRPDWNRQDHRAMPARAPLPSYQRRYNGERYPQDHERQQTLHDQNYRYQPRDISVQQPQHAPPQQQQHEQRQAAPPQHAPQQGAPEHRGGPDKSKKGGGPHDGERGDDKGRDQSNDRGNHGN